MRVMTRMRFLARALIAAAVVVAVGLVVRYAEWRGNDIEKRWVAVGYAAEADEELIDNDIAGAGKSLVATGGGNRGTVLLLANPDREDEARIFLRRLAQEKKFRFIERRAW